MSVKFTVTFNGAAGDVEPFHFTQYAGNGSANTAFDLDRTGTANSRPTKANADLNVTGYIRFKQFQLGLASIAPSHNLSVISAGINNGVVGKSVRADVALAGTLTTFDCEVIVDDIASLIARYDAGIHGPAAPVTTLPEVGDMLDSSALEHDPASAYSDGDVVYVPSMVAGIGSPIEDRASGYFVARGAIGAGEFEAQAKVASEVKGLRWDAVKGEYVTDVEEAAVTTGWEALPEFAHGYGPTGIAKAAAVLSYELTQPFSTVLTMREHVLVEHNARDWDPTNGGTVTLAPRAYVDMRDVESAANSATVTFTQSWS